MLFKGQFDKTIKDIISPNFTIFIVIFFFSSLIKYNPHNVITLRLQSFDHIRRMMVSTTDFYSANHSYWVFWNNTHYHQSKVILQYFFCLETKNIFSSYNCICNFHFLFLVLDLPDNGYCYRLIIISSYIWQRMTALLSYLYTSHSVNVVLFV